MAFTMLYQLLVNTCVSLLDYKFLVNWEYAFLIFFLDSIGPTYTIGCLMLTGRVEEFA